MYTEKRISELNGIYFQNGWYRIIESITNKVEGGHCGNICGYYENGNKAFDIKFPFELGDKCVLYYEDGIIKSEATLIGIDSEKDEKRWSWKLYYPNGNLQLEFESIGGPVCYQDGYLCDDGGRFEGLFFGKVNIEKRDPSYVAIDMDGYDDDFENSLDDYYLDNAVYMGRYDNDNGYYVSISHIYYFYSWMYDGKFIEYYRGGQLKKEATYKEGMLNGKYVSYFENGNKRSIENYHNTVPVGKHIKYNENGEIESVKNYENGNKHFKG